MNLHFSVEYGASDNNDPLYFLIPISFVGTDHDYRGSPLQLAEPTPCDRAFPYHLLEYTRQMALVRKSARFSDISNAGSGVQKQILRFGDALLQKPAMRWYPCCVSECACEMADGDRMTGQMTGGCFGQPDRGGWLSAVRKPARAVTPSFGKMRWR